MRRLVKEDEITAALGEAERRIDAAKMAKSKGITMSKMAKQQESERVEERQGSYGRGGHSPIARAPSQPKRTPSAHGGGQSRGGGGKSKTVGLTVAKGPREEEPEMSWKSELAR